MKVLIVAGGYLPGYRYGGPVRSLAALVAHLGDEISFSVVTSDHDLGVPTPYDGIQSATWLRVGKADVWYASGQRLSPSFWRKIMADRKPDVVYLNSFMSPATSALLIWRKARLIPQVPVVLAPRGEFAPSALQVKSRKKQVFRKVARLLRLHHGLIWQASAPAEAADIRREQPNASLIVIAPDLTISSRLEGHGVEKQSGSARFAWIGRIASVKNLEGVFGYLGMIVRGMAHLEIYGPIEDERYWLQCLSVANRLPENATYEYCGEVPHEHITASLSKSHFLLSPSRGENFGHTVAEALDQGLPVILSDQTPWRDLEKDGVGWAIPLEQDDRWRQVLEHCVDMDNDEYQEMSTRCRGYVDIWMNEHGGRQANLDMFRLAAGQVDKR